MNVVDSLVAQAKKRVAILPENVSESTFDCGRDSGSVALFG